MATSLVRVVSIVSGVMGDDVATLLACRVVVSRLSENISKKKSTYGPKRHINVS